MLTGLGGRGKAAHLGSWHPGDKPKPAGSRERDKKETVHGPNPAALTQPSSCSHQWMLSLLELGSSGSLLKANQ